MTTRRPGLACPACGRRFEAGPDEPWRCGRAVDFERDVIEREVERGEPAVAGD